MRTFLVVTLCSFLSACAVAPAKMSIPFDERPFAFSLQKGTGIVSGQAFLKTRGGDIKLGAGNVVELVPFTPYIAERLARGTIAGENIEVRDPRVDSYVQKSVADAGGNFEFTAVPAGDYVVYCLIQWGVPSAYSPSGVMTTGGMAYGRIKVAEGQKVRVMVTR